MLANEVGVGYLSVFIGISTTQEQIPVQAALLLIHFYIFFSIHLYLSPFILLCIPSLCLLTASFPTSVKNALILSLIAVAMAAGSGSAL